MYVDFFLGIAFCRIANGCVWKGDISVNSRRVGILFVSVSVCCFWLVWLGFFCLFFWQEEEIHLFLCKIIYIIKYCETVHYSILHHTKIHVILRRCGTFSKLIVFGGLHSGHWAHECTAPCLCDWFFSLIVHCLWIQMMPSKHCTIKREETFAVTFT